jgi:FkbM family methyltransferase
MSKNYKSVKKKIALWISGNRQNFLFKNLNYLARAYVKIYENNNNDHKTNGEERVLNCLGKMGVKTIFDVGSNVGDWSLLAQKHNSNAQIHAFEPIPITYQKLKENTSNFTNITSNNLGLSNSGGKVKFSYNPERSIFSSMINVDETKQWFECDLETGDNYCLKNEIETIDFLKIDVEGAELLVFQGFEKMFNEGRIKMIQFEYGAIGIKTKFLLYDFYEFLKPRGFIIGKIYPNEIGFREYHREMEDFIGLNYLAVHQSFNQFIKEVK